MSRAPAFPRFFAVISLALFLSSCLLSSREPLNSRIPAAAAPEIFGVWHWANDEKPEEEAYLAILEGPGDGLTAVYFQKNPTQVAAFEGFVSEIGKDRYLNLKNKDDPYGMLGSSFEKGSYLFAHVSTPKPGKMALSLFNEDFFRNAVQSGKLAGSVEKGNPETADVRLTDTGENISRFIKELKKEEYLEKPVLFRKMKD